MWFVGPRFDLSFFHLPVWLCWVLAFALPAHVIHADLPLWVWLVVVVLIDVGHVWSSIYRTYLDPVTRKTSSGLLIWAPVICFAICFFLALESDETFWRVLAYIATYHFVKQQVGLTALYRARQLQELGCRRDQPQSWIARMTLLDKLAIYAGTVGPLLWWHAHLPRKIAWFVQGDYLHLSGLQTWFAQNPLAAGLLAAVFYGSWIGILLLWLGYHLYLTRKGVPLQWGKLLWVGGTAVNWYLGLVYFDSDLVFTLTNVVAHGIPYYGLMALHGQRRLHASPSFSLAKHAKLLTALALIPLLLLAVTEEYFWDVLLFHDNPDLFGAFLPYTADTLNHPVFRAVAFAALSLPQTVHYLLDGFIWKVGPRNPDLKTYLFDRPQESA